MTAPLTLSRNKKREILRESIQTIIDLMLLDGKYLDWIHMGNFKELSRKLKSMQEMVKRV
jgi:hypothetical protein